MKTGSINEKGRWKIKGGGKRKRGFEDVRVEGDSKENR